LNKRINLTFSYLKYPPAEGLCKQIEKEIRKINIPSSGDYDKLRGKVAGYFGVNKKNILAGNGSDEIIDLITRVWKGKVIIPVPTFSQYEQASDKVGSEKILVNCFQDSEYSINYSQSQLLSASLVWICNPNNPTGSRIHREEIIHILKKSRGIVAVDECYYEYLGETVIDLINEFNNLIVLRSFSKNFGLSGLRLGFAISMPENIKKLEYLRQLFNVNKIAEKTGEKIIDYIDYYKKIWEEARLIRDNFIEKVGKIGLKPCNSYANFVLVEFKNREETERVWKDLKSNGIYTFPSWSEEFSGLEEKFIRFVMGTKEEMDKTIEILSLSMKYER